METRSDVARIPAGAGSTLRMAPPEELDADQRRQAIAIASAGIDAMRINVRVEHPDGRSNFCNARDLLAGQGPPLGLPTATERLLRDGLRRLLAAMESARPGHAVRSTLQNPVESEPAQNRVVVTCRSTGAVTDLTLENELTGASLCSACDSSIEKDVTRDIVHNLRRVYTVLDDISEARVLVSIRTFDQATEDGFA